MTTQQEQELFTEDQLLIIQEYQRCFDEMRKQTLSRKINKERFNSHTTYLLTKFYQAMKRGKL